MKPIIKATKFGKITVDSLPIDFDFFINAEGKIMRRIRAGNEPDDLCDGILSLNEADMLYDPAVNAMIIGCTRQDTLKLSNEATDYFEEKKCKVKLLPLMEAISYWNRYEGNAIGLFHLPKH